jgi:hypothetical protein
LADLRYHHCTLAGNVAWLETRWPARDAADTGLPSNQKAVARIHFLIRLTMWYVPSRYRVIKLASIAIRAQNSTWLCPHTCMEHLHV